MNILDQQVTRITRPDNQIIDFNYDNGERFAEIVLPKGSQTYTYDSQSGQVTTVNKAASGTILSYDYDGPLLLSEQWSGGINGMVNYSHTVTTPTTIVKKKLSQKELAKP